MSQLKILPELAEKVPEIELSCIECDVVYETKNQELWNQICLKVNDLNTSLKTEEISQIQTISASRKAYKSCGKDPTRYRLSAEALLRRVVKRNEIYQVCNVVDLLNLVSISSGFSIGGYDAEKIIGNIGFGVGYSNEPYFGIGRGGLNIEFMPVFRDEKGAFGTSTSDSVRTSVTENTHRFLMIIVDYGSKKHLNEATEMATELLKKYASATNFEIYSVKKS